MGRASRIGLWTHSEPEGDYVRAVLVGDSQGEGLRHVLGPALERHGYALDAGTSWTEVGASTADMSSHLVPVGAADTVLIVSGGNDGNLARRDPERYAGLLRGTVEALLRSGARRVLWVGPMRSTDAEVSALHEGARSVQARTVGRAGATWIDGYTLSGFAEHAGDGVHFTRKGYGEIAAELERAIWSSGTVTVVGLAGSLVFLGAAGVLLEEWLRARVAA